MPKLFSRHLFWKFFLSYFAVVLLSLVVLGMVIRILLPGLFDNHLFRMTTLFSQYGMEGGMEMMHRVGMMGGDSSLFQSLFEIFNRIIFEAVLYAVFPSLVVALGASAIMSRSLVKPLEDMAEAADRIAEGHYQERLPTGATSLERRDELGRLADRFNRMTVKLETNEEMRQRLIGDVAHELRTPLTVISGSMEGLMDGVLEPTQKTFEMVYRQADRLERLVDDLQQLHFLESGEMEMNIQTLDLKLFLEKIMETLAFKFEEQGVELKFIFPEEPIQALADVDRLSQIMINLLSNALRYTPQGGSVRISVEKLPRAENVVISVSDTGIGIPQKDIPHIFDRFYRVDGSRSRSDGGSGIGLTITKRLVQAQGGKIWAESAGIEKGATFRFTLPLAESH